MSKLNWQYKDNFPNTSKAELLYMAYYFTSKIRREIGRKIRKVRKQKGLLQVEVAVDAGLSPSYYSKIERGEVNPSLEKIHRIIKSLEVKSSDILPF